LVVYHVSKSNRSNGIEIKPATARQRSFFPEEDFGLRNAKFDEVLILCKKTLFERQNLHSC